MSSNLPWPGKLIFLARLATSRYLNGAEVEIEGLSHLDISEANAAFTIRA